MYSIDKIADYGMVDDWDPVQFAADAAKVALSDAKRVGMTPHRINGVGLARLRMQLPDHSVTGFTECLRAEDAGHHVRGILQRTWKGSSPIGFGLNLLPSSPPEVLLITQGTLNYLVLDSMVHSTGAERWLRAVGAVSLNEDTTILLTLQLIEEIYGSACEDILLCVVHQYPEEVLITAHPARMWPGAVMILDDFIPLDTYELVEAAHYWNTSEGAEWLSEMGTELASIVFRKLENT